MPWNSTSPDGTLSVKANRPFMQQNTTYIEDTMGNSPVGSNGVNVRDHFWNIGSNEDGRHRFIQSPGFTVGGNPEDPTQGTGMDGIYYLKLINGQFQWFRRNTTDIYQATPNTLTGTIVPTSSFTNIVALPPNVYGEVFMFVTNTDTRNSGQTGFFKTSATTCEGWAHGLRLQGGNTARYNLIFGNGSDASGLNLRVIRDEAPSGLNWEYRITYRSI